MNEVLRITLLRPACDEVKDKIIAERGRLFTEDEPKA
jgi:hypothetical protein